MKGNAEIRPFIVTICQELAGSLILPYRRAHTPQVLPLYGRLSGTKNLQTEAGTVNAALNFNGRHHTRVMPALGHSLGSRNPRNVERRQERARQVLHRIPIELGASVLGLRRQRVVLEGLLATAAHGGDTMAACRVSDSLVKIADLFSRLAREGASKRGQTLVLEDVHPIGIDPSYLEEQPYPRPPDFEPLTETPRD